MRFGDAESLSILRDAGAKLTGLERDVSEYTHGGVTHHGELSERSEVQMRSRPARKRGASAEVIEALTRRLDEHCEDVATEAASALRELVCANAENRRASRDAGAVPKLLRRIRAFTCVESIGALRNIANDPVASNEAGELGAVDALVDVIRTNAASVSPRRTRSGCRGSRESSTWWKRPGTILRLGATRTQRIRIRRRVYVQVGR